jgi:FAD/FMN-containing dehydrogenase
MPEAVAAERRLVAGACRQAGAQEIVEAADEAAREALWRLRRELSPALRTLAPLKLNHDVVVPKGRIPQLFALVEAIGRRHGLRVACFGHAGDGNIHVNLLLDPDEAGVMARARRAERELFEGVVALEGSISGEHGIGVTKAPYLGLELSAEQIALMKRVKAAFDPHGILNPGKIFPE